MDDRQIHRDIGRLEGKVEAQGERLDQLVVKFDQYHEQNSDKLQRILAHQERQRGAARVWGLVVTALSSFIAWLVTILVGGK